MRVGSRGIPSHIALGLRNHSGVMRREVLDLLEESAKLRLLLRAVGIDGVVEKAARLCKIGKT